MSAGKRRFHKALLKHLNEETISEIMKEIQDPGSEEHDTKAVRRISKITSKIRESERQTDAALKYAESLKKEIISYQGLAALGPGVWKRDLTEGFNKQNFVNASKIIDMFQEKDWEDNSKFKAKEKHDLFDFIKTAQKAEKFRMDDTNWSQESKKENKRCIEKHMQEGLGLLPFEKILFQTRGFQKRFGNTDDRYIAFHLFEYREKNIEKNTVTYDHRALFVKDGVIVAKKQYLLKTSIIVPLDFKRNWTSHGKHFIWASNVARPISTRGDNFHSAFIQLNSHTDKNASIRDIVPKNEKPSTSFKIKSEETSEDEFVPVWKSKTVYIKPDEYRTEKDTTYTSDVSDDEPHEKRLIPYHSVRGHIRRLRKGDITSVRSHYRGQKEYGAIHKNYVLAAPRIMRKGKII